MKTLYEIQYTWKDETTNYNMCDCLCSCKDRATAEMLLGLIKRGDMIVYTRTPGSEMNLEKYDFYIVDKNVIEGDFE